MDRNCPEELRDDPESAYTDSKALIERWHGKGRLGYAITPRFALTSSDAQLEAARRKDPKQPAVSIDLDEVEEARSVQKDDEEGATLRP